MPSIAGGVRLRLLDMRMIVVACVLAAAAGLLPGCQPTGPERTGALVASARSTDSTRPALIASADAIPQAGADAAQAAPRNVIVLFADGAAPTQWEFGRHTSQALRGQPFAVTQEVFDRGTLGLMETTTAGTIVTDSAAAATAMSTGLKTRNGAVGVGPDGKPATTLLETARARGFRTGLVTTATVYDASPAAFSVHARSRDASQAIVDQYLQLEPDVLMGGGADFFLPAQQAGGRRDDRTDVLAAFAAKGYQVARAPADLGRLQPGRVLGLFAEGDLDLDLDRDPERQPSLAQMTQAALAALARPGGRGFVLFVESEHTDTAGHRNDVASLMRALWAFDDAVKVALQFRARHPDTLVIVTGDHETGGFSPTSVQRDSSSKSSREGFYAADRHLRMIARIDASFDAIAARWATDPTPRRLDALVAAHLPGFVLDDDLRQAILSEQPPERSFTRQLPNLLGRMVARQTGFYWGTAGHTSEPIAVGAIGPGAQRFGGYRSNTDFARRLAALLQAEPSDRQASR